MGLPVGIVQFWPDPHMGDRFKVSQGWWVDYWMFRGWWVVKPEISLAVTRDGQVDDVMTRGCDWTPAWYFPTREQAELAFARYQLEHGA